MKLKLTIKAEIQIRPNGPWREVVLQQQGEMKYDYPREPGSITELEIEGDFPTVDELHQIYSDGLERMEDRIDAIVVV